MSSNLTAPTKFRQERKDHRGVIAPGARSATQPYKLRPRPWKEAHKRRMGSDGDLTPKRIPHWPVDASKWWRARAVQGDGLQTRTTVSSNLTATSNHLSVVAAHIKRMPTLSSSDIADLAQLAERSLGMGEVRGSTPLVGTSSGGQKANRSRHQGPDGR